MKDYLKKYYASEHLKNKDIISSKNLMNDDDSDDEKDREAYDGKQI